MFHHTIDTDEIVRVLMEDTAEAITRLATSGFPLDAIPPHYTNVYFSTSVGAEGVFRGSIQSLTDEKPNMWAPLMLSRLDEESSEDSQPLGSFLGFLGCRESEPHDLLLFGVLLSPTGSDAVGMYTKINSLKSIQPLWVHPFEIAPYLNQLYIHGDPSVIH